MVGRAPTMRWLLVIFLSESRGTLKSTCSCQSLVPSEYWDTNADEDSLVLDIDIGDAELVREGHAWVLAAQWWLG